MLEYLFSGELESALLGRNGSKSFRADGEVSSLRTAVSVFTTAPLFNRIYHRPTYQLHRQSYQLLRNDAKSQALLRIDGQIRPTYSTLG